jgi:vacuolar-type H+-ATPase subunit I/STV1
MDIKKLLGEELFAQVEEKIGDKQLILNDGNYIPKGKFDELNNSHKEYKAQLEERDKQLAELKKKAKGNEELTQQLNDLQEANKQKIDEYENKLSKQKLNFKIREEISKEKAKNVKAVEALLDMEKVKMDGETVTGLSDQLKTLKESDPYLFGDDKPSNPGANPPADPKRTVRDEYNETKEMLRKNPNDQALSQKLFILKSRLKE